MKNQDQLNSIMKQKLQGHEVTPPDSVWENIGSHLDSKKNKNRGPYFIWASVLLALFFIGSIAVLNMQKATEFSSDRIPESPSDVPVITSNDRGASYHSADQGLIPSSSDSRQIQDGTSDIESMSNQSETRSFENTISNDFNSKNNESVLEESVVQDKKKTISEDNKTQSENITTNVDAIKAFSSQSQQSSNNAKRAEKINLSTDSKLNDLKNTAKDGMTVSDDAYSNDNSENVTSSRESEINDVARNLRLMNELESDRFASIEIGHNQDENLSHIIESISLNNKNGFKNNRTGYYFFELNSGIGVGKITYKDMEEELKTVKTNKEKIELTRSTQAIFGYKWTGGFGISSGIEYAQIVQKLQYEDPFRIIKKPIIEERDTPGGIVYDTIAYETIGIYTTQKIKRTNQFSVPLIGSYEIGIKGPWGAEIQAGPIMNFYTRRTGHTYISPDEYVDLSEYKKQHAPYKLNMSFYASIGVLYNVNPKLTIIAMPSFKYQNLPQFDASDYNEDVKSMELKLGVRYYF